MSYIGKTPTSVPLTSSDITDGIITTTKIADDAATADKIANAVNSAITANTSKTTNATHSGEVTGSGALTIADNAVTLAKMAAGTDGNIISYDASGDPVAIATGSDGQVLTSTGAGSPPAFEAIPGGGKIGQVLQAVKTDTFTTTSTSFTDLTDVTQAITPAATSSKILVNITVHGVNAGGNFGWARIMRGSTVVGVGETAGSRAACTVGNFAEGPNNNTMMSMSASFLDSPSTSSAVTYKVQVIASGSTLYVNRSRGDGDNTGGGRPITQITLMEVLA